MNFFSDDELPLYDSMSEDDEPCCFCDKNTNDPMKFGKKMTIEGVTVHHFCLVSHHLQFVVTILHRLDFIDTIYDTNAFDFIFD